MSAYRFRSVTPEDVELVCRHRHEMFRATGRDEATLAPMTAAFRPWLARRLTDGRYFGWIAEAGDEAVAGLGMMEIEWPPHPSHPGQDRRGYILNVYVEPAHRGVGLARALMALATEEGRRRGLQLMVLHATTAGRPLYETLGWAQTSEMSLAL